MNLTPTTVASYWDELEKVARSALRSRVEVTPKRLGNSIRWDMTVAGKPAGFITTTNGTVKLTKIKPAYRGMGLGKKLYGEVARRMPNQTLKSDKMVSREAARVWRGMGKRKYNIRESVFTFKVPGDSVGKGIGKTHYNMGLGGPVFKATLPPQAGIGQEKAKKTVSAFGEAVSGYVKPKNVGKVKKGLGGAALLATLGATGVATALDRKRVQAYKKRRSA